MSDKYRVLLMCEGECKKPINGTDFVSLDKATAIQINTLHRPDIECPKCKTVLVPKIEKQEK